ncbi:MAG: hypothetical protein LIP16_13230 [Clostridium sp.]|nr:hypothetical protein [Clostridium sp.]
MRNYMKRFAAIGIAAGLSITGSLLAFGSAASQPDTNGNYQSQENVNYPGRYVDGFTLGMGSDRGGRLEIEKVEDGYIWASVYSHDYSSSGTTVKGRLEGVRLEGGIAKGTYVIGWNEYSDTSCSVVSETGTFEVRLKDAGDCSVTSFNEGTEYEAKAYSPVAVRFRDGVFEDYYLFQDEWQGEIANWFMSAEDDLF